MTKLLEIDKTQRRIISMIFRIVIILYTTFILIYKHSEYKWYINLLIIIVYLIFYFILLKDNLWLSRLRLLNDYAFIGFILIQYQQLDIYLFALLFILILNSHNHSGEKKWIFLYIIPIGIIFLVDKKIDLLLFIPLLLFFTIYQFDKLRDSHFILQNELNEVIDNFFIDENMVRRPHKVFKPVINILNESNLFSAKQISNIICIKIENNKIHIVCSSSFVWNLKIEDKSSFINKVVTHKSDYFFNENMKIDHQVINKNAINICKIDSYYYCFIMYSINNRPVSDILNYQFFGVLSPFFHRFSYVLDSEYKQKRLESNKLYELQDKINYVSNSANAMHFIRNKISPLQIYLDMYDDYEKTDDLEKKRLINNYLEKERMKLRSVLDEILQRADYILKKSNNPFNVISLEPFGFQQLFSLIRRIWNDYLELESFEFESDILDNSDIYEIEYNRIGIELVLINWISNISRYNSGEYHLKFSETESYYIVTFVNAFYDNYLNKKSNFATEYMSSDRIEISKRKTHGLLEIKDFLSQMKIDSELTINDNKVFFIIKFRKILKNEGINI